jgi:branched-subunit amino acid aminotransferase/4-amino-4-deoxychorismate lyase
MSGYEQNLNGLDTLFLRKTEKGRLVETENNCLVNRAAYFGDGVFETMIFSKGKIRFAGEHQKRLNLGLHLLKIAPSTVTVQDLENFVKTHFSPDKTVRIRWNVYRAGLGKYTPQSHRAEDLIMIQSMDKAVKIKPKAYISKEIRISPSFWSHCKTLNGLSYVMANIERMEKEMDEVILMSNQGFISEAGTANIFWKKENTFYTPSLSCNCIAGVARRKIIDLCDKKGLSILEGEYVVEDIMAADQVFTSNVSGIAYIASLDNKSFGTKPLPLLERLFE